MRASAAISQLELSLRLGVSQRHVSFVELGRALPSRGLILRWADATGATPDERNAALLGGGYSPAFFAFGAEHERGSPAFKALSDMLAAHEPNPGIIFDSDWMISAMNASGHWLCTLGMPDFLASMDGPPGEMDMIAAVSHPGGLLAKVRNAAEAGFALLRQLRTEQLTRPTLGPRVDRMERSLRERFGEDEDQRRRAAGDPHLQLVIDTELGTLAFLLVQTVFGLPQNVTQASLRTELWFPIDAETKRIMETRGCG
ncbi:helix-turn-helix domain-containing protein [Luteimonas sp. SJ-92]|uniref:Helix-turn-helix domain-containing protein n=2 Tax=Luteimonas salinisoli TaxID=2752307 RepID=A0A853J9Y8_9GAMM|nr:helix-turn-helix domain-containing protein [Luteimonas salinisoli]